MRSTVSSPSRVSRARALIVCAVVAAAAACSPYRQESPGRINADVFRGRLGSFVGAVAGTSANDVFVAGSVEATGCQNRTLAIARWDGAQWTDTTVPAGFGRAAALAMVSPTEGYAIVEGCDSPEPGVAFLRWNGVGWTPIGQAAAGVAGSVTRIQVLASNSVWFAANSAFAYYDGTMLRVAPATSGTQILEGFAALSATDVLVLSNDPFNPMTPRFRRYKDGMWAVVASPVAGQELTRLAPAEAGAALLGTNAGLFRWSGAGTPTGPIAGSTLPVATLVSNGDGNYFVERARCASLCNDLNSMLCRAACSYPVSRGSATGERDWPRLPAAFYRTPDGRFWQYKPDTSLSLESFE
ncbi:MAG: hypothetical protein JNK05_40395 [Myxococcales bacterium]|nr:hypothetical protein [Myxococcales bacterium]